MGQSLWLDDITRGIERRLAAGLDAEAFAESWRDLMSCIASKSDALAMARQA